MDENQAREGYRAAIQLISHDAKIISDSFRSLLAANTPSTFSLLTRQ